MHRSKSNFPIYKVFFILLAILALFGCSELGASDSTEWSYKLINPKTNQFEVYITLTEEVPASTIDTEDQDEVRATLLQYAEEGKKVYYNILTKEKLEGNSLILVPVYLPRDMKDKFGQEVKGPLTMISNLDKKPVSSEFDISSDKVEVLKFVDRAAYLKFLESDVKQSNGANFGFLAAVNTAGLNLDGHGWLGNLYKDQDGNEVQLSLNAVAF